MYNAGILQSFDGLIVILFVALISGILLLIPKVFFSEKNQMHNNGHTIYSFLIN